MLAASEKADSTTTSEQLLWNIRRSTESPQRYVRHLRSRVWWCRTLAQLCSRMLREPSIQPIEDGRMPERNNAELTRAYIPA
jgi:hypothetical protein